MKWIFQPAWQHDGLAIDWRNAKAATTVVVFASFGVPPEEVPSTEFHGIFLDDDISAFNLITVMDRDRRFYTDGRSDRLADTLNGLIARTGARRVVTIGVSMGGFAAVAYARRLAHCNYVIAFGAHSAINPALVPFDVRSPDWRARIRSWDILDGVAELADHIDYDLLYGSEDEIDRRHAERFAAAAKPNVRVSFVQGSDHNVAAFFNTLGVLHREVLTRVSGPTGRAARRLEAEFRTGLQEP